MDLNSIVIKVGSRREIVKRLASEVVAHPDRVNEGALKAQRAEALMDILSYWVAGCLLVEANNVLLEKKSFGQMC